MHLNKINTSILIFASISLAGCKKFVDVGPPDTQLISQTVFDNDVTATAAINGIYSTMMNSAGFASWNITLYGGLSADEYINYSPTAEQIQLYTNSLNAQNTNILHFWTEGYQYIYMANAVLKGLQASTGVTNAAKEKLEGEAQFIRAFCYFYLVNFFGEVPLALNTDYQQNNTLYRSPVDSAYQQIIADLQDAAGKLPGDFSAYNNTRLRPTRWAAQALLARVYLYTNKWDEAESAANNLLEGNELFHLENDLGQIFTPSSQEAIWQLSSVDPFSSTWDGYFNILTSAPNSQALRNSLLDSFETSDLRKANWINSYSEGSSTWYFSFKYQVKTISDNVPYPEHTTVLRLAELFLIRAEARLAQNNISGAVSDMNVIRRRAGLADLFLSDPIIIRAMIVKERQRELFCEWSHRWLDLKRLHLAGTILPAIKGISWNDNKAVYPIPQQEITNNGHLTQNNGY